MNIVWFDQGVSWATTPTSFFFGLFLLRFLLLRLFLLLDVTGYKCVCVFRAAEGWRTRRLHFSWLCICLFPPVSTNLRFRLDCGCTRSCDTWWLRLGWCHWSRNSWRLIYLSRFCIILFSPISTNLGFWLDWWLSLGWAYRSCNWLLRLISEVPIVWFLCLLGGICYWSCCGCCHRAGSSPSAIVRWSLLSYLLLSSNPFCVTFPFLPLLLLLHLFCFCEHSFLKLEGDSFSVLFDFLFMLLFSLLS